MQIQFRNRTNTSVDRLVEIAWEARASHEQEYLRIPEREEAIYQLINDEEEVEPEMQSLSTEMSSEHNFLVDLSRFRRSILSSEQEEPSPYINRLLIAIDTGVVNLGEFVGGAVAFAIRGAAVCLADQVTVFRYNTGPILVDNDNQVALFHFIGSRLGNEELYLSRNENGDLTPRPSAFETGNQLRDRCRNFVERMIQEEALSILVSNEGGYLLLDGALPAGTYDTPVSYLQDILTTAARNRVDVVAVSKKSRISVGGKPIGALFDDRPDFVGYVALKDVLAEERERYVDQGLAREVTAVTLANELFAVRFGLGPPSLTFRVDVHNSIRQLPSEVLESLIDRCQIQGCYPRPLVEAHQFSSFTFQDVQTLLADLIARTGARPKEDPSMEWIFSPFGASGK